jgi:hypothetical protein
MSCNSMQQAIEWESRATSGAMGSRQTGGSRRQGVLSELGVKQAVKALFALRHEGIDRAAEHIIVQVHATIMYTPCPTHPSHCCERQALQCT